MREAERDALVKMVTADAVRAVLLYGEVGAGRTTFLTTSVIPALQAQGVLVVLPLPAATATQGFVEAVRQTSREAPQPNVRASALRALASEDPRAMMAAVEQASRQGGHHGR